MSNQRFQTPLDFVFSCEPTEQIYWINLPDICLQNIFIHLGDQDRCNSAMVCRKWNEIMNSAVLWKSRTITLRGKSTSSSTTEFNAAMWYTWKFGSYIEHLEIRFLNSYNEIFVRKFQRVVSSIFETLGRSNNRLKSLSMPDLGVERFIWKSSTRDIFVRRLCSFLKKTGKLLKYLNFKGAKMSLENGCAVLDSLSFQREVTNITELDIEDFFCSHVHVYSYEAFNQAMSTFKNLSILSLNYNCVSDDLLQILCTNCSHSLLTINIMCHMHNPHLQVVWGMYWAQLAKQAKNLNVNFYLERVLYYSHLSRILLSVIPVRSISLRSSNLSDPDWNMCPTLVGLLPNYRRTLKKLTLEFNNSHESLDEHLVNLVLMCEHLYYLKVSAFLNIQFAETILQNCEEGKCFLKTLKVRIYTNNYYTLEEDQALHEIFKRHSDFILTNMDYYVIAYPML
ncbi:F-box only protein 39-like [Mixophyes fleayi]|uniref:F-box only protein 39-like n=1 Tax=Mixophyes fleayi TaxID=3061075 RepID=UPI003F4D7BE0